MTRGPRLRGKTDAETCRLNGWTVGDQLAGDEGYGPSIIEITAIGEERILARCLSHFRRGEKVECDERESSWTLVCRDWRKISARAEGES